MTAKNISFKTALKLIDAHPKAATPDIEALKKPGKFEYTERVHEYFVENEIDLKKFLALPQKQVKRGVQFLGAILHDGIQNFDATHARVLIAMRAAGVYKLQRDAIIVLAAGKRVHNANTRGITKAQIDALFARTHGISTVKSKVSNSIGKNGFYSLFGITSKENSETVFALNAESPLLKAFYSKIDNASESTLREMSGEKETA